MSNWENHEFEDKIVDILSSGPEPQHHFGRPFLTAYQLAIDFKRRFPSDVDRLGYKVGGAGTGERASLAQYLARELSGRIKSGRITRIEGAFLSNRDLTGLTYDNEGAPVISSVTGTGYDLSMFRLRG